MRTPSLVAAVLACSGAARAEPRALSFSVDGVDRTPREVIVPVELPAGMHVVAMAITVDGARMHARAVAPGSGRERYERIVELRRDPALLEDAGAGRLRLRVFPLVRGHAATNTLSIEPDNQPIFEVDPIRVDDTTSLLASMPGDERAMRVLYTPADVTIGRDVSLSPTEVRRTVRLHLPELRHCYEQAALRDHALAGVAQLHFTIEPDGGVTPPVIDGTLADDAAVSCMTGSIATWRFRESSGPVAVNYPITFSLSHRPPAR